jgi:hypothetical protein
MRTITRICTIAVAALPAASLAESPLQIYDKMQEQEQAGIRDNKDVTVRKRTMGIDQIDYYEAQAVPGLKNSDGEQMYVLRTVPPQELQQRQAAGGMQNASAPELRAAADKIEKAGKMAHDAMQQEMQNAQLPGGLTDMLMSAPKDQPWLSPDPQSVAGMYATMLRGAAQGKEEQAARDDPAAMAQERAAARDLIAAKSRVVGTESIDGNEAFHIAAENVGQRQVTDDGQEITLNTMNMWVDANAYVPLRLQIDGELDDGKQTRQIRIERDDKDYRHVDGCGRLYKPFLTVMKISGIMDEEQKAQMAEAQAKMAELDKQLAQMPASQRDMIMRQMGPQMEMMKNMASGGGIEIESRISEMHCNTGPPNPLEVAQATMGGGMLGMGAAAVDDGVLPYYVDEKGIGIIRYADAGGAKGPFFLTVRNKTAGTVVAGPLGPYTGPKVGIYIGSLKMLGLPYSDVELELYQDGPHRTAARFRPEVDPAKAESQADCGNPSATGECSR